MADKIVGVENDIAKDILSLLDGDLDNLVNIVTKGYADIAHVFGGEMALAMYANFRGCTVNCAMNFFKKEYVVEIAMKCKDKRERERIAMICGYSSQTIEKAVREKSQ